MFVTYLVVNLLAAALNAGAATANLSGHHYPTTQADKNRVPRSLVPIMGLLLGAGALGLLAGFVVPVLGTLAATGLVLYFLGAFVVHLLAKNYRLGGWALFFVFAVGTLTVNVAYHGLG